MKIQSIFALALTLLLGLGATAVAFDEDPEVSGEAGVRALEGAEEEQKDEHGHEAHIGAKGVKANPAGARADLAIWTFVIFCVVLAVLWKFAWKPIAAALDRREQSIADNIAAAQRQNDEAKALLMEYSRKLDAAQGEVREILEEARRDAEHTQREILAAARQEANKEKNRALAEIDTATNQALKELGERSANLAVELAGRLIRAQLNREDHDRLIDEAVTQFAQTEPSEN